MTISRANMEKQVKYGNKKAKKMLQGGDVSPLMGAMTGKGMMGRALGKGMRNVSPLGRMISDAKRKKEEAAVGAVAQAAQPGSQSMKAQGMAGMTPMKAGGAVKKKRDGCAIKGKTKGTIR